MADLPDLVLKKPDGGFVEVRGGSLPSAVLAVIEGRAIILSRNGILYDEPTAADRAKSPKSITEQT